MSSSVKCVVVGAGPVGALAALYAARRGWDVEVFELRGDIRDDTTSPLNFTKSINLALSERGINAMRNSGSHKLLDTVLAGTIPMYGRMIHGKDTNDSLTEEEQLYDVHGRYIRAVDRANLNKLLLDELQGLDNVTLHFHHKLTGVDLKKRKAWFEQTKHSSNPERAREVEVGFDFLLGCDGAHSSVRYHLMKFVRMDYQQNYIDTLWCEFTIPPTSHDDFAISQNHLHIWPGAEDMFIAIPSTDKSFTCTLFAPSATFSTLEQDPAAVKSFFDQHFPGAVELIGASDIQKQFERNPHLPLINIKCSPHHFGSSAVILGDAAHAMVPFYGQGMNAGLEDVNVLFAHLDQHPSTAPGRADGLAAYTAERIADAHTINDLALANYWEMHAGVRSRLRQVRKSVEEFLSDKVPWSRFKTQYSRVSFSTQRYSEVAKAVHAQDQILLRGLIGALMLPVIGVVTWYTAFARVTTSHHYGPGNFHFAALAARIDRLFKR